jgi:hypothetical protein
MGLNGVGVLITRRAFDVRRLERQLGLWRKARGSRTEEEMKLDRIMPECPSPWKRRN